jgi:hypothetical protein
LKTKTKSKSSRRWLWLAVPAFSFFRAFDLPSILNFQITPNFSLIKLPNGLLSADKFSICAYDVWQVWHWALSRGSSSSSMFDVMYVIFHDPSTVVTHNTHQ